MSFSETTPEDIREFRHDFSAQMKYGKKTKNTNTIGKSSLSYFKNSLLTIKDNKLPLAMM